MARIFSRYKFSISMKAPAISTFSRVLHCSMLFFLFSLVFISAHDLTNARMCNGLRGLCRLKLSEVTLAGTHNSGAGFDGHLWYGVGTLASSCFYRNQGKSITGQLDLGIRYFDIDSCWNTKKKTAFTCHSEAYGGSIAKFLRQVDEWMKKNVNEVVVLHFNRDYDKGGDPKKIGRNIIDQMKNYWNPTKKRLGAKQLSVQTDFDATLGDAITNNQRIYIIMHEDLSQNSESWLFSHHFVGYTWQSMSFIESAGCSSLADKVAERCDYEARRPLVRLDLYLSYGLCIDDLASWCNTKIKSAAEKCRNNARNHGGTVSFIVVDYADLSPGRDVVKVAKEENLKNIQFFR